MKKLYCSLIQPYINYESSLGMGYFSQPQVRFIFLRKKSIRAAFNLNYNVHTNDYFKIISIPKCNEMYKINLCCYLYKMLKSRNRYYFAQYVRTDSELHNQNTRNTSSLIIPIIYLSVHKNHWFFIELILGTLCLHL